MRPVGPRGEKITHGVREHHAPVGALRLVRVQTDTPSEREVRERHAPVGALRPNATTTPIATKEVREHHAPVGALRLLVPGVFAAALYGVREHHAPVGALRPGCSCGQRRSPERQGALRTCRCIVTAMMARMRDEMMMSGSTTHL